MTGDVLDVAVRVILALGLATALVTWLLARLGRYQPRKGTPEQYAKADRLQPFVIGMLGLVAVLDLALDEGGRSSYGLAIFLLIGWTQDRLWLRARAEA